MMYGFGDDPQPFAESVELLEDLVLQYITDMVCISSEVKYVHSLLAISDIASNGHR